MLLARPATRHMFWNHFWYDTTYHSSPHIFRALLEYFKSLSFMSHHTLYHFYRFLQRSPYTDMFQTIASSKGLTKKMYANMKQFYTMMSVTAFCASLQHMACKTFGRTHANTHWFPSSVLKSNSGPACHRTRSINRSFTPGRPSKVLFPCITQGFMCVAPCISR
jgi:hypothetical protein